MHRFKSVQFMSAEEKKLVFRNWERFLVPLALDEPGQKIYEAFTNRLYYYLSQHCSFIAHYNRNGFYETYFANPEDTPKFLQQFDRDKGYVSWEYGATFWLDGPNGDYADINRAMCEAFDPAKAGIYAALRRRSIKQRESQLAKLQEELDDMRRS